MLNNHQSIKPVPKKKQVQYKSKVTGHYITTDEDTGIVLDIKKDGTPFKGVKVSKAKKAVKAAPSEVPAEKLPYETAVKLENAVLTVRNRMIKEKLENKNLPKKAS